MLERIENVNEQVIEKMFLLYAESMADMEGEFKDRDEMEASYAAFLKGVYPESQADGVH